MTDYPSRSTKALRVLAGLSQRRLAERAGVAKITVGRIERGETASLPTLQKIATALEVRLADLIEPPRRASTPTKRTRKLSPSVKPRRVSGGRR